MRRSPGEAAGHATQSCSTTSGAGMMSGPDFGHPYLPKESVVIENPYYTHEFHGDYELISIGPLELEEGGTIPDCHLAVATFGAGPLFM